jgi:arginase family enzyme
MQTQAARVGRDPVDRVVLMENHDQAYHAWRDAGSKNKVLVHIDAHHDMSWTDSVESMTIANFISQALKNDLVRETFWIVPDATWRTEQGRQAIRKHVTRAIAGYRISLAAGHGGAPLRRRLARLCLTQRSASG